MNYKMYDNYITYHVTGIRLSPNTDLSYAALNASTDEADLTFAGRAFHGFTTRLLKKLDLRANDEVSLTRASDSSDSFR